MERRINGLPIQWRRLQKRHNWLQTTHPIRSGAVTATAVQIVSTPPAPAMGARFTFLLGQAGHVVPLDEWHCSSCCCCCCLPSETYGRNGATPIFRSFFTELPVPPQAAGVVGTFNVLDIYPSEHYGLSFFGPYGCLFFLQGLLFFVFFFVYISIFASTLCMCVMYLTSIWRIILMTDGLNAVWSNDRAAPTDTNPKNLKFAPPQSAMATRIDQLVYSPNYYIQIFTQLFARSEDWTLNLLARSYQVQCAYQLGYGSYILLLIKADNVETNPGPTTTGKQVWISDICHRQIHDRKQISIMCNRIEHWVKLWCAAIRLVKYVARFHVMGQMSLNMKW